MTEIVLTAIVSITFVNVMYLTYRIGKLEGILTEHCKHDNKNEGEQNDK